MSRYRAVGFLHIPLGVTVGFTLRLRRLSRVYTCRSLCKATLFQSNPCPKMPRRKPLRAQSVFCHSLHQAPTDRIPVSVASSKSGLPRSKGRFVPHSVGAQHLQRGHYRVDVSCFLTQLRLIVHRLHLFFLQVVDAVPESAARFFRLNYPRRNPVRPHVIYSMVFNRLRECTIGCNFIQLTSSGVRGTPFLSPFEHRA